MAKPLAVVIMAAGKGTRMKNPNIAKVMYEVEGKPMVEHVIEVGNRLGALRTIVIVGWQKESVVSHLARSSPNVKCVEQSPQLGTGHAVMQAEHSLRDFDGDVLVLSGDVPLLTEETTRGLINHHRNTNVSATVLTAGFEDPTGYGRIIRNHEGHVVAIVEHKDASPEQLSINEINSGIYVFDSKHLFEGLRHITPSNSQNEYYLTDVFGYFWRNNLKVAAVKSNDAQEILGVNTFDQLESARRVLALRKS